jgi:hypothetical protein
MYHYIKKNKKGKEPQTTTHNTLTPWRLGKSPVALSRTLASNQLPVMLQLLIL